LARTEEQTERRAGGAEVSFRRALWGGLVLGILIAASFSGPAQEAAQEPVEPQGQAVQPLTVDRTLATLHGVVRNAATGEGLPRALVRVEGDADSGVLTDGDGRFEIPNIPVGPQIVDVRKPGFRDASNRLGITSDSDLTGLPHNVMVAAEMADVVFTLAPMGAIRGQVELSTGDAAGGIAVLLARRAIADGRAMWQAAGATKTRSDGTYRIGGLADGEYAIFSQGELESELDTMPGAGVRWGYPSVYYPDARDPSGAGKIHVANGAEAQANLTQTLEPFQAVSAAVTIPQPSSASQSGMNFNAEVMDGPGHSLGYPALYNQESHSIQANLPDGSYTLLVSRPPLMEQGRDLGSPSPGMTMVGMVDFAVAGHAVPDLRVTLSAPRPGPVQISIVRSEVEPAGARGNGQIIVMMSRAGGWIDDGMMNVYVNGNVSGPLEGLYTPPGSYWVHTNILDKTLCESSFTAGGASLAREPVVIGLSGSTAPMELTLRDDCAGLQLSLPETLATITAGVEPFFTVYVVPDFDFTTDLTPVTLRPSTGGTVTLSGLTPGNYHVYTLPGFAQLEYRNREALAALPNPGQAITLSPGTTGNLIVEAPGP
jgi:hypothetical protein